MIKQLKSIYFLFQYNIKKKEELVEAQPQEEPNPLMRKKKTPEELAAEAEQEDLDDFTSKYIVFAVAIFVFKNLLCILVLPNHTKKRSYKWN